MDAWMIAAVATEIRRDWSGARVERVVQPTPHEVALQLRRPGQTSCLLLCAHPQLYRAHLVVQRPAAPPSPPMFCQVLRRHLDGSRLLQCSQPGLERVMEFHWQSRDELGNPRVVRLIAELTGRLANLVLVGSDGRVLDALRRVDGDVNRVREILPGQPYAPPPRPSDKIDPVEALRAGGPAGLAARLADGWRNRPPEESAAARLQATVFGLTGPLTDALAGWAAGAPGGPPAPDLPAGAGPLAAAVAAVASAVVDGRFRPCTGRDHRGRCSAAAWPLPALTAPEGEASASAACERAYAAISAGARQEALRQRIGAGLRGARARLGRRLDKQRDELRAAGEADGLREQGEVLLCHLGEVPRGATAASFPALDRPDRRVEVTLDPRLSASANAQRLLQRYQKAKRASAAVAARLAAGEDELRYLDEAALALEQAEGLAELEALDAELEEQGLRGRAAAGNGDAGPEGRPRHGAGRPGRPTAAKGRSRTPERRPGGGSRSRGPGRAPIVPQGRATGAAPLAFAADGGWQVLVGRNAVGNDHLTMRLGRPDDLWLHARQMPGSHVLLRPPADGPGGPARAEPPEPALLAAARCAAYYSAGRAGSRVPVDWTRRRHVWKPAGARPGFVLYEDEHTLLVDPTDLPPRASQPDGS